MWVVRRNQPADPAPEIVTVLAEANSQGRLAPLAKIQKLGKTGVRLLITEHDDLSYPGIDVNN